MNIVQWTLLVGFFLPLVIAIIQQESWGEAVQAVVTIICVLVASLVVFLLMTQPVPFVWPEYVGTLFLMYIMTITAYYGTWLPTGLAPVIEHSTSFSGHDEYFHSEQAKRLHRYHVA